MGFAMFGGSLCVFIFKGTVNFTTSVLVTELPLFIYLDSASFCGPLVSTTISVAILPLSVVPFSLSFQFLSKILLPGYPIKNSNAKCAKMISYLFIFSQVPALVSKNHRLLQEAVLYKSKNQRLCKQPVFKFFPIFQLILNLMCISFFICRMGGHNKNTALIDLCGFIKVAYIRLSTGPRIQEGLHQC